MPDRRNLALAIGLALAGLLPAACNDGGGTEEPAGDSGPLDSAVVDLGADDAEPDGPGDGDAATPDAAAPPAGPFGVRGTLEQVYVWNAPPDTPLELVAPDGSVFAEGTTDSLGSFVFRGVAPAADYMVRLVAAPDDAVRDVRVYSAEELAPDTTLQAQVLQPGFGYLTTRDGTRLSIFVTLPGPPEEGPYPTVVTYSGYSPSRPGRLIAEEAAGFCDELPILCNAPDDPNALIAGVLGYATVGVNMRGTGCSGGPYDYFEPLQLLDGYDAVETVARQPWVLDGKVGLVGLSYPGIAQLFVARTRPPSLAVITPMSVIADSGSSVLLPGGIYNQGFALAWIQNVLDTSRPYGREWVQEVVDGGDEVCRENQLLHSQNLDVVAKALANPYYSDDVAKPVDPSAFAPEIDVPVYLSGQWQDEQTGPHFAALLDKFTGAPISRFFVTNGVHLDGLAPQNLMEWFIFLELYVAKRVPHIEPRVGSLLPVFFTSVFGTFIPLPENRFEDAPDHATALAAYEAEPRLRVTFDSGAAPGIAAGAPQGAFAAFFDAWPIPETVARRWYLQPDGTLGGAAPVEEDATVEFHPEYEAGSRTTLPTGSVDQLQPPYDYRALGEGYATAWISPPLEANTTMAGSGSADLWLKSTADDADLEVNLTEVRPDGQETYVQSGWLRASHRKLRADATELRPVKSHYLADLEPLVPNEWTYVRVEIMPFAHVFRAGSRIRLSVDTPGDSRAAWQFILLEQDERVTHTLGNDATHPSSVVLPEIPGVEVPTPLPESCAALRGQPCRPYVPLAMEPPPPPEEGDAGAPPEADAGP